MANEVQAAHAAGVAAGLPVVPGEWAHEGGYHYYPPIPHVRAWVDDAAFVVVGEDVGDDYHHVLVRTR